MRTKPISPGHLVDRLEKKYQKKAQFQRYKSFTKHLRQNLSQLKNMPVRGIQDDRLEIFGINDYEYIGR